MNLTDLKGRLLLGTNNPGKIKELRAILAPLSGIEILTLADLEISLDVEETGDSYAQNATLKALAFAKAGGMVALADDSGLEVDALDGAPGMYSARYLPKEGATDADRRVYLVQNLADAPRPWTARFPPAPLRSKSGASPRTSPSGIRPSASSADCARSSARTRRSA